MSKEILSGNRYFIYHVISFLPFASFSIYHYFFGSIYISAATAIGSLAVLYSIYCKIRGTESNLNRDFILFSIITSYLISSHLVGIKALIWSFPLIIGIFFNYSLKFSIIASSLCSFMALYFTVGTAETQIVVRFGFSMLLTIIFASLYKITVHKHEIELETEASVDYLTGMFNRRSFNKWLSRELSHQRNTDQLLAVFYLDIDNFKQINDSYGHAFGDKLLIEVGKRVIESIRPTDACSVNDDHQLARVAGDEFVVAASDLQSAVDAEHIATRLLLCISKPIIIGGIELHILSSVGVALCKGDQFDAEQLLRNADAAMYRAKELGKNRITFFDKDLSSLLEHKKKIAAGIKQALSDNEFNLNFMPIFAADGETIAGAEVLIRSKSSSLQGLGPHEYIPIAEEYGLIQKIDLMVINMTFAYIKQLEKLLPENFIFAINISANELHNEQFPAEMEQMLNRYQIPAHWIELELTETSLVSHDEKSISMLKRLKSLGINLSLDDFGTGYTAFNQLQHYPVDTLKIDRSFVWNIDDTDPENINKSEANMVDVILSLAKLYRLRIVAEGVENQKQLEYLQAANCDFYQGFYLAKPMPWEQFYSSYFNANFSNQAHHKA